MTPPCALRPSRVAASNGQPPYRRRSRPECSDLNSGPPRGSILSVWVARDPLVRLSQSTPSAQDPRDTSLPPRGPQSRNPICAGASELVAARRLPCPHRPTFRESDQDAESNLWMDAVSGVPSPAEGREGILRSTESMGRSACRAKLPRLALRESQTACLVALRHRKCSTPRLAIEAKLDIKKTAASARPDTTRTGRTGRGPGHGGRQRAARPAALRPGQIDPDEHRSLDRAVSVCSICWIDR